VSAVPRARRPTAALFVALAALMVGSALSVGSPPSALPRAVAVSSTIPKKPNIILILTDDQRWDSMPAMPNVRELLGGHGVTFQNSFVTTSLCCPSRSSLLTGQYSRHTGVYSDVPPNGGATSFRDTSTVATWLKGAGYNTAFVGKYLNDYRAIGHHIPPGWDEWDAIVSQPAVAYDDFQLNQNGRFVQYGPSPSNYSTTVLGAIATRFLEQAKPPFFLHFAPIAPHAPAVPLPRDADRLTTLFPDRSPSFDELDVSDKPWGALHPGLTLEEVRAADGLRQRMLQTLTEVDRVVAGMVRTLTQRGQLQDTVIVYTSDNGYLLGEHRLFLEKIWPYEESIRVPLVIRTPWATTAALDSHLVLNIDLAPTIAELAGIRPAGPVDGASLVPLLQGRDPPWRTSFVEEFLGRDQRFRGGAPPFEAIRTERYLFVVYTSGWKELYDLQLDPYELQNLAGDPLWFRLESTMWEQLRQLLTDRPPPPGG
jgi:N-acetylglucosamine-6-sulfatase